MTATESQQTVEQSLDVDLYQTLVRLIAGGLGEGVDRLKTLAHELESADNDPESTGVVAVTANPVAMAMIGWVSEAPQQIRSATTAARRMMYPLEQILGVAVGTGAVVAGASGASAFVSELSAPTREAIATELQRLANVGTAEYARGRVFSVQAFERSVDGMIGYLGESEELGDLVREQTLGITGAAVQEIRETSAVADGLTEGIIRKLLGRKVRSLPPLPMASEE